MAQAGDSSHCVSRRRKAASQFICALLALGSLPAAAKTPGATHCYGKTCHRVSTVEEMDGSVGRTGVLKASFYDDCRSDRFNACGLTSSGAIFRPDLADNAASPIFPDGTVLLAYNPETKKAAVLRVNSAGPYWGDRKLDVSRAAAEKLGFRKRGVAELMVTIVKSPVEQETRYSKMREYSRVPGYIGAYPDFHTAHAAALAKLELEFETKSSILADADNQGMPPVQAGPKVDPKELFQHTILHFYPVEPAAAAVHDAGADTVHASLSADDTVRVESGTVAVSAADVPNAGTAMLRPAAMAHVAALAEVKAIEPDYSWEGLRQRLAVFLNSAVHRARAPAPPPSLPPPDLWSEKLVRFVWRARQQAREGIARRGTFGDLFAESPRALTQP